MVKTVVTAKRVLKSLVSITRRTPPEQFSAWRQRTLRRLKATLSERKWRQFETIIDRYVTGELSAVDQREARALVDGLVWLIGALNALQPEDINAGQ